jgi:hypothetical protein
MITVTVDSNMTTSAQKVSWAEGMQTIFPQSDGTGVYDALQDIIDENS